MDIRHAVGAAAFTGLAAAGIAVAGGAAGALFDVDGVAVSVLESSDYMPPNPSQILVDGVAVTVLESSDYMPQPEQ